jgi:hypothetical protein
MTKKELQERVSILETQLYDAAKEAHERGEHLVGDVFIPQYLGFEETVVEDKDIVQARIYTKKGFNISRPVNTDDPKWVVLGPDGIPNAVHLYNMHHAMIVLKACGMDISMDDYNDENKKAAAKFLADISPDESIDLFEGGRVL